MQRINVTNKMLATGLLLFALFAFSIAAAPQSFAQKPGFGNLYYNGTIVHTVVPPAKTNVALDNFYKVTNVAVGQLGIAAVAPGNPNYHGGHWKVFIVTFNTGVTPTLLTSESAVLNAESAGLVTVTANPSQNFLCPVQL